MSAVARREPRSERRTQNRVAALFTDKTSAPKQAMMQALPTGRIRLPVDTAA